MDEVKNIILNTREEQLEKILSPFIQEQFPYFMRSDYAKLILVIKAYYEWLDQQGNVGSAISNLDTVFDLDENVDQFFSHFKNTYLRGFPDTLATDVDGNVVNKKTLLKKIREFYGKKGTESAYKFLFRALYDSDVEFYYPKTDIVKVSDGQWIEPKSIKTTLNNGEALFAAKGGQVVQYRGNDVVATAFINSIVQYTLNGLPICEFFLSDIVGEFVPDIEVTITKDELLLSEVVYPVLGQFFVEVPGKGYRIGDTATIINTSSGTGFSAKVEQVGLAGSIKKLAITNSGVNYESDVVLNIFSESGTRSAKVIALRTAITNYPGYFSGNRGKVSSDKKIFDGHYYQEYSYELKTRLSFDVYFDALKKLIHPAGMRMFGSVLLKGEIDNLISTSTQAVFAKSPVLGRYTPYTQRSYNNLRSGIFLPNQISGGTLQVWLTTYNLTENTNQGVSANLEGLGASASVALGIQVWKDIARGVSYTSPDTPNQTIWSVPRLKESAVNTHPSLVFRPNNNSGSDFGGDTDGTTVSWRSYGYWGGLTVGALQLFSDHTYFVVAKARLPQDGIISLPSSRHLIGDVGGYHGIVVGANIGTNNQNRVSVAAYTSGDPLHQISSQLPDPDDWFLVSSTHGKFPNVNGSLSLFVNGVCAGTVLAPKSPILYTGNSGKGFSLGIGMKNADPSAFTAFDGEIAEVICYQGDLSQENRQRVEGYLAHKYGLTHRLPDTHPYKISMPVASYNAGYWLGNTGDYYPLGYNPFIQSTTQVGPNGTTASLGSLFYNSELGYTFTVVDEHGITSHNSIGSPLGSTHAWKNESALEPSSIKDLILWLKPENIGVCGSVVNGASMDVWRDASAEQNHAVPPTWDRFTYQSTYQGITIDKLRPTLSIVNGITGISFGGGKIFSPWVSISGTGKTLGGLGISFAPGGSGESLLTARHFYLTRGITLDSDCDIFMVFKPNPPSGNQALVSSNVRPRDMNIQAAWRESVFNCRDWNASDRNPDVQNSTVYYSIVNGVKRYYSIVGPFAFIPYYGTPTLSIPNTEKRFISYDPHVCGLCFDRVLVEAGRDRDSILFAYYNGDRATNRSPSTGLSIMSDYGESESSFPIYNYPIAFGRFGAFVWGNGTVSATGTVGSTQWLNSILSFEADYSFSGIINEVIVFKRKLSEEERQIVYSYLSRKYRMQADLPDKLKKSHNSAYLSGITYWGIDPHPNANNTDTIPVGSEFSGVVLRDFFAMNQSIYRSAGTALPDRTILSGDTYDMPTGT